MKNLRIILYLLELPSILCSRLSIFTIVFAVFLELFVPTATSSCVSSVLAHVSNCGRRWLDPWEDWLWLWVVY